MKSTDVLIIGAGISGLLAARELAAAGRSVRIVDKGPAGRESSWAGGGILSPLRPWRMPEAVTALCAWSQQCYPGLVEELLESTGLDPEWRQSGLLILDPEEPAAIDAWCAAHGVRREWIEPAALASLEPRLAPSSRPAIRLPGVAQVRNPRLLRAILADVRRLGIAIEEDAAVTAIEARDGRVSRVATAKGVFVAETYLVTAGAWSAEVLGALLPNLPVVPVKGQMLAFQASGGLVEHIVLAGDRYLIPRRDGIVLCGSTVERRQFDKVPDVEGRRILLEFACRWLSALADAEVVGHWAGLRPGSPEGIPFIGPVPSFANLYLSCGHFRNGLTMAPASARLVADLILGRPPIVPAQPYGVP
ncbi:glycine oxidase ThiO [Methylococcus capsulatus]|uniref:glycine oxidase ThiO n=1 Tax=Methylococcus capsulatus TaxID=414 RepID=UPI0002E763AF|nr:glycine oxidase ThiO [Methylococcus capsulatus]